MPALLERLREALAPRYEVESEVASGGMGTVFGARDTTLDRRVAIKVLRPEETSSSAAQRLFREARILASLSHPHVVSIFDAGEVDDCFYFVMDYVEGETLEQRLARGPLSAEETTRLADNLLDALAAAHGQGIIHRDVKPSNVFVQEDHYLLGDFGIAKKLETKTGLTEPEHRVGTPGYMAPEQAAGDEVTMATDIYSAGMVLYEAATGKPWSIMHASQMDWSAVPGPLVRPLKKALEWEPGDRWPNAADLREAIVGAERRLGARTKVISAGAAVTLTAAIAVSLLTRPEEPALDPNKVVVVSLENQTGDESLDPVGYMAADLISQSIAKTGLVDVVPTSAAMTAEQSAIREAGLLAGYERAHRTAETIGAGTLIWGSYYRSGDSLLFQIQITDASRDRLLSAPEPVSASEEDPRQAISELQQRVMGALGASLNPLLGESAAELAQPPQYDAYLEYAKGLDLFAKGEYAEATYRFHRAAALDSTFATAQLWATMGHYLAGHEAEVDSIIRLVERSRDRLTPADRAFLDYMIAYKNDDMQGAYEAAHRRVEIAEEPVWLWILALASQRQRRPREAVQALERIDPEILQGTGRGPMYFDILGLNYHTLGEHEQELAVAHRARQLFPDDFIPITTERAALIGLGRVDEVMASAEQDFIMALDEGWLPTSALGYPARELRAHGYPEAAKQIAERAIAWHRSLTPEEATELTGHSLLTIKFNLLRWLYRAERYQEALPLAAEAAEQADAKLESMDHRSATAWRAAIAANLGERDRALVLVRDALTQGVSAYHMHVFVGLEPLYDDPAFQQLIEPRG
jgi:tetratricopeptide (TPR) repeat protein